METPLGRLELEPKPDFLLRRLLFWSVLAAMPLCSSCQLDSPTARDVDVALGPIDKKLYLAHPQTTISDRSDSDPIIAPVQAFSPRLEF